jgi:deoxyribose-phosphate aldolase
MCYRYTPEKIASVIDLAALSPVDTRIDTINVCQKAAKFNCASVCVKPCFVSIAAKKLDQSDVGVGTVINFPHGNSLSGVVALEAYTAIGDGAVELDMVINIGAALSGEWNKVLDGIEAIVSIAHEWDAIVKVILETCYLTASRIRQLCKLCVDAKADFVKTSTGYEPYGATREDVEIMMNAVAGRCEVKASGGIKTYADAEMYLDLGCTRLGTSRVEELFPYEEL